MNHSQWILPRRQTELPARGLLPEATLHYRRETTFLALAALFLVASAVLVLLGTSRVIDVSALLASVAPDVTLPTALLLPLGVVPFALSFVAAALVCQLFGPRRATALVIAGSVGVIALAGMMRVADLIDGGDAFGAALAFAAAYVAGHATNLLFFERLSGRRMFWPLIVAATVANVVCWAAFAATLHVGAGYLMAPIAPATLAALAAGSAAWSMAVVLVLAIPAAATARALAVALRIGRDLFARTEPPAAAEPAWTRRRPPAMIVDDEEAARARARRPSLQPFSSAEMRFFSEGDALGD